MQFSITLLYSNENEKGMAIYLPMGLHQYGNQLEADLLEQEQMGFEPRNSGFKTDRSTKMKLSLTWGQKELAWAIFCHSSPCCDDKI